MQLSSIPACSSGYPRIPRRRRWYAATFGLLCALMLSPLTSVGPASADGIGSSVTQGSAPQGPD